MATDENSTPRGSRNSLTFRTDENLTQRQVRSPPESITFVTKNIRFNIMKENFSSEPRVGVVNTKKYFSVYKVLI